MHRLTAVTAGLFANWVLHDLEELLTMRAGSREVFARLPSQVRLPDGWREHGVPQEQVAVAIGLVAAVMAAASADGYRTGGRSAFYRGALLGYGVHGFGHLAGSALTRSYTSGVATAPVLVIPFWLWAEKQLRDEGVAAPQASTAWALLTLPLIPAAHVLAHRILRRAHQAGIGPSGERNSRRLPNGSAE